MLKNVTSNFINDCNDKVVKYSEYLVLEGTKIPIKAELDDDVYENGNFIGTFILKTIKFETDEQYNFKNKEFKYYKTVNGESIKIGTFITTEITINDTTEIVKVVGMDYGLKTQIEYKSLLDYSSGEITLLDVWNEACEMAGLESGVSGFVNDAFIVDSDQFSGTGATVRDVFKAIGLSSGTFIKVMNDDKIYPIFKEETDDVIEDYVELEDKRDTRPWTCLRLGDSQIEGLSVDYMDDDLIAQYGENWLILNDNPFAYTQKKRQELIMQIFNQIKGFGYSAFVSKTSFKPYLTTGDVIKFKNKNGSLVNSIILKYNHKFDEITLQAPSETSAEVNYIRPLSDIEIAKKVEIIVDRQESQISSLVEDMYDEDGYVHENFTSVNQGISSIITNVQNTGGGNMLKNSVMFLYDNDNIPTDWELSGQGTLQMQSSTEAITNGGIAGHEFVLNNLIAKQRINVKVDEDDIPESAKTYYTFSTKIKKGATGSCYVKIYNSNEEYTIQVSSGETSYYGDYEIKGLLPKVNYYDVEFYGSADSNATFTDNMFALGNYRSQWQQANGEIMNTQVSVDINGIQIKSNTYTGQEVSITPFEFAGYAMINGVRTKVFTLNNDTTEVEKINVRSSISMPPIKIVPITTGNLQGWAFISTGGDS